LATLAAFVSERGREETFLRDALGPEAESLTADHIRLTVSELLSALSNAQGAAQRAAVAYLSPALVMIYGGTASDAEAFDFVIQSLGWAVQAAQLAEGDLDPEAFETLQQRNRRAGGIEHPDFITRRSGGRWWRWAERAGDRADLSKEAMSVAPWLSHHADQNGTCFPSIETLVRRAGVRELERALLLTTTPATGRRNTTYRLFAPEVSRYELSTARAFPWEEPDTGEEVRREVDHSYDDARPEPTVPF